MQPLTVAWRWDGALERCESLSLHTPLHMGCLLQSEKGKVLLEAINHLNFRNVTLKLATSSFGSSHFIGCERHDYQDIEG